jgi:hypothetical protein
LGIHQIFNAHLGKAEELDEVVITQSLHVIPIKIGISYVLKQGFELAEIALLCYFVDIGVHNVPPVQATSPFLELESRRHGSLLQA